MADGQGAFANGAVGHDPFERVLVRLEQSESFRRLGELGRLFLKRLASIFAAAWALVWLWGAVLVDGWCGGRIRRAEKSTPGRIRLAIVKAGAELLVLALFAMMIPAAWSAWASVAVVASAALFVRMWLIHTSRFD